MNEITFQQVTIILFAASKYLKQIFFIWGGCLEQILATNVTYWIKVTDFAVFLYPQYNQFVERCPIFGSVS